MIVIDYVDGRARTERISDSSGDRSPSQVEVTGSNGGSGANAAASAAIQHQTFVDSDHTNGSSVDETPPPPPPRTHLLHRFHHQPPPPPPISHLTKPAFPPRPRHHHHPLHHQQHVNSFKSSLRSSHSSDSSSAYSGSDTMQSAPSSGSNQEPQEVDLSGLMESVVDSDEEEDLSETSLIVRDAVRECLEKDPSDRTEDDVDILLEFTQHFKAFTNMTLSVRRALVATMVFAVVEKAGTVVMTQGEELDSWSVIINGHVEIVDDDGDTRELHLGDSFGITPTMDKLYHRGVMRTKCDDCQFVCVTQSDYYRILHQGVESQRRHENENGEVVLVTEHRKSEQNAAEGYHVVIRGTPERLMAQLMEDNSDADPTFIEDFLLTYRTFLDSPTRIMEQLLDWFRQPGLRDKVTRVLLLWVNNHFTDFETDPAMMEHLERFEAALEAEKMQGQLRMLNFACAAKARKRTVTLTRPSRDQPLQFSVAGGYERGGCGIFVARVERGSKAAEIGLKRGDQILEVNGQSFEHVTKLSRALEILRGVCHLSITVKSNLLAFSEMLQAPDDFKSSSSFSRTRGKSVGESSSSSIQSAYSGSEGMLSSLATGDFSSSPSGGTKDKEKLGPSTSSGSNGVSSSGLARSRINRAFNKLLHKPKSLISVDSVDSSSDHQQSLNHNSGSPAMCNALSNPDLLLRNGANGESYEDPKSEFPEHVLKVYKSDQTFKYLLVHKETTAHEVVMLSLQEFGITESSSNFTLCEVSVAEGGFVKQRRLPDALQNLAERIGLASRYYIKNVHSSDALLPDDMAGDLTKDASVSLLQLNPVEVATQLMVEDFTIFRQIEATEYVDDLFELPSSRYGTPSLSLFSELVNREMMWTISEVVGEQNAAKRMRIVKQFIKVARQCKETQNFNSMFAIISGLGHGAVSRLKSSWEKLPTKYQRMFSEMQQLMDPSRNMSRYRNLVSGEDVQPPIIPFYPVVKKDLTFIHLANDSRVDNLVNFEKLRMIAKEVRTLTNMCSAPLDLFSMLELGGQQPSNAMVAMNQLTAGGQYLATVNRRRKKTSGVPNPKRMFEEAQMVRRVKAYLNNMKVITDEEKLHQMSLECEPLPSGQHHQANQQSIRKRNPSPTPSAMSSTSSASHNSNILEKRQQLPQQHQQQLNTGNKFGAASPHAVKKLLSLSEQSKTRHKPSSSASIGSPLVSQKSRDAISLNNSSGSNGESVNKMSPAAGKVDLTAESSSVTVTAGRKKQNGSVTSTDSGLGFFADHVSPSSASSTKMNKYSCHHGNRDLNNHHHGSHNHRRKVRSSTPDQNPQLVKPHSLLHSNNFARMLTASSRLNAIPPLPPPKQNSSGGGSRNKSTIPTYYVADPEEEDDDETQVSAV